MAFRFAAARAAAPMLRARAPAPIRLLSTTLPRLAGDQPPVIQGDGAKPGETPTNWSQATGLERFEMLGKLEGVDVFDAKPLVTTRLGTVKEPILIKSYAPTRIVGCTGYPAGAHDTIWIQLQHDLERCRCPECGSVYKLDFHGDADEHH